MSLNEIKDILIKHKPELQRKFKVKKLGIFGSYIRGDQAAMSDLDILVDFEADARLSLLDLVGMEIELSDLLGIKVDLVEKKCLKPTIGRYILKEVQYI